MTYAIIVILLVAVAMLIVLMRGARSLAFHAVEATDEACRELQNIKDLNTKLLAENASLKANKQAKGGKNLRRLNERCNQLNAHAEAANQLLMQRNIEIIRLKETIKQLRNERTES